MKCLQVVAGMLCFLMLPGCQGVLNSSDVNEVCIAPTEELLQSSLKDYSTIKASICEYNSDHLNLPENRTVEINLSARDRLEGYTFNLSSSDISVNENAYNAVFGYCPNEILYEMTGCSSGEEVLNTIGQPYMFEMCGDRYALLFINSEQTFIFGRKGDFTTISIDYDFNIANVNSIQISDDEIYLIATRSSGKDNSVFVLTFSTETGKQDMITVPFSDMQLPEKKLSVSKYNPFIYNKTLFFSVSDYSFNGWIAAYNFDKCVGSSLPIEDFGYDGQIFMYDNNIGYFYSELHTDGYNNSMKLILFDFNYADCEFTQKTELDYFPEGTQYYYYLYGYRFYCIDDMLCGVLQHMEDNSLAYIEISLKEGKIKTFVPFYVDVNKYFVNGYSIKDSIAARSRHNIKEP